MKVPSLTAPSRPRPPAFAPVLGVGPFGHALALAMAMLLLAFAHGGEAKAVEQWSGTDIAGEGSLVAMAAVWLAQLRASRPGGRVTDWLCIGLAALLLGQWADLLDEFWRLPKAVVWDNLLESTLLPLGALCLTIGLHHWRLEQRALGDQLVKRERLFREHRSVDAVTQLGDAGYMAAQIAIEQQQTRPGALVMLALDDGAGSLAGIAREHGLVEADRLLQALTHLLLLNLRAEDLLCRYAGDRFCILMPGLGDAGAAAAHLAAAVASLAHHGADGLRVRPQARAVAAVIDPARPAEDQLLALARRLAA